MIFLLKVTGAVIAIGTLFALVWSIYLPERRWWPPQSYKPITPVAVWGPTFTLGAVIVALGVLDWGSIELPWWVQFGIGPVLILLGNVVVWFEVAHFGVAQTGGATGTLRKEGLYRFSRNPQYVADTLMIIGWVCLSAASDVLLVGALSILVLVTAPFAEEPWLQEIYGDEYDKYRKSVRRYF